MLDGRYKEGLEVAAYLYNKSIELYGENRAVYTQKCRYRDVYEIGVLDMECSVLSGASDLPWQTDTTIGDWFYDVRAVYKTPREIIDTLVDIVSKNGNLLLNIVQKPDGTIDDEGAFILDEVGGWLCTCGEGRGKSVQRARPDLTAETTRSRRTFRGRNWITASPVRTGRCLHL